MPASLNGLKSAIAREAEAAAQLSVVLKKTREAMETLNAETIEVSLAEARESAEQLGRCGSGRIALTRLSARSAGLDPESPLSAVAGAFGPELGKEAKALAECLDEVEREAAATGIAARYGAGIWAHLLSLSRSGVGAQAGYGRTGLLRGGMATVSRRV